MQHQKMKFIWVNEIDDSILSMIDITTLEPARKNQQQIQNEEQQITATVQNKSV